MPRSPLLALKAPVMQATFLVSWVRALGQHIFNAGGNTAMDWHLTQKRCMCVI